MLPLLEPGGTVPVATPSTQPAAAVEPPVGADRPLPPLPPQPVPAEPFAVDANTTIGMVHAHVQIAHHRSGILPHTVSWATGGPLKIDVCPLIEGPGVRPGDHTAGLILTGLMVESDGPWELAVEGAATPGDCAAAALPPTQGDDGKEKKRPFSSTGHYLIIPAVDGEGTQRSSIATLIGTAVDARRGHSLIRHRSKESSPFALPTPSDAVPLDGSAVGLLLANQSALRILGGATATSGQIVITTDPSDSAAQAVVAQRAAWAAEEQAAGTGSPGRGSDRLLSDYVASVRPVFCLLGGPRGMGPLGSKLPTGRTVVVRTPPTKSGRQEAHDIVGWLRQHRPDLRVWVQRHVHPSFAVEHHGRPPDMPQDVDRLASGWLDLDPLSDALPAWNIVASDRSVQASALARQGTLRSLAIALGQVDRGTVLPWDRLQAALGGLPYGLQTLVGAPGVAKTALVTDIACHAASQGTWTLIVELELDAHSMGARIVTHGTGRLWSDVSRGRGMSALEIQALGADATRRFEGVPLHLLCTNPLQHTAQELLAVICRELERNWDAICLSGRAPLIILDYLQIATSGPDEQVRMGELGAALISLRNTYRAAVICVSATARDNFSGGKAASEPWREAASRYVGTGRGSSSIEYCSDSVWYLVAEDLDDPSLPVGFRGVHVGVAKRRDGPTSRAGEWPEVGLLQGRVLPDDEAGPLFFVIETIRERRATTRQSKAE